MSSVSMSYRESAQEQVINKPYKHSWWKRLQRAWLRRRQHHCTGCQAAVRRERAYQTMAGATYCRPCAEASGRFPWGVSELPAVVKLPWGTKRIIY